MIDQLAKDPLFHLGLGLLGSPNFASGVQNGLLSYGGFQQGELARQQLRQKMEDQQRARERDQAMRDAMGAPMEQMGDYAGPPRQPSGLFSTDIREREMARLRMAQNSADPVAAMASLFPQTKPTRDPLKMVMTPEGPRYVPESMAAGMTPYSSPMVSINEGQELPTDQQILRDDVLHRADAARERNTGYLNDMAASRDMLPQLLETMALLDEVETGFGAETILKAKKLGKTLGMDVDEANIASAELLQKFLGDQVMSRIAETKGAVSQKEMDLFTEYSASFGKTPEGNKKIVAFQIARAQRAIQIGEMVRKMQRDGRTSMQISDAVGDYLRDNDLSEILVGEEKPVSGWAIRKIED